MAPLYQLNFRAVCTFLVFMLGISARIHVLASGETSPDLIHDEPGHTGSIFGDPFEEILERINKIFSSEERNITYDETTAILQNMLEDRMRCSQYYNAAICETCLNAEKLFTILGVQQNYGLDEEHFNRACVVLLYYVTNLESTCANASLTTQTYGYFAREVQTKGDGMLNLSEEELEETLDAVASTYAPDNFAKCFTAETIFEAVVANHETGADDHELENVAAVLISSLVRGFCIGNATEVDADAFLDEIFETYATDGIMSEEKFLEIQGKLASGGDASTSVDEHGHAVRRRSLSRSRRNPAAENHRVDKLGVNSCFSVDELFDIFGVNHSTGLTRQQFKEISPALIQQAITNACMESNNNNGAMKPSPGEVWGYGILAVFLISLCAVAGVVFLPCLQTDVYTKVLQMMMALAVATLVGDAIIHLIPQAVGLHAHDATTASNHNASSEELNYIWKCLVVFGAVYAFFLFESLMHMSGGAHSHSSKPDDHSIERTRRSSSLRLKEAVNGSFRKSPSKVQLELSEVVEQKRDEVTVRPHTVCCGIGTLPFMILIGDGLHNLGDGLAIGAAFATSIGAGLSTSVAVLCHELPHELGDFAVLLNAGLSFRQALGFNFLSAMMAFIGLCIGIPLASGDGEAKEWIFAVAAGMFLYVALVDMLPELIHHEVANKGIIFLLHNLGFLAGGTIILVIALYEDAINISI